MAAAVEEDELVEQDAVAMANNILQHFSISPPITTLQHCDTSFFIHVYEAMLGECPPGLTVLPASHQDKLHNMQVVVDSLATDVLGIDLSHIDVESLVHKSKLQIRNLLEIFDGLLECLLEELDRDKELKERTGPTNEHGMNKDDVELPSEVFLDECSDSQHSRKKTFAWLQCGEATEELVAESEAKENTRQQRDVASVQPEKVQTFSTHWSSILKSTSSAVDSQMNELGRRPRRRLAGEEKKIQEHKHTHHHHYHHHHHRGEDSSDCCSTASSSKSNFCQDSLNQTAAHQQNTRRSTEMQTHRQPVTDCAIQTSHGDKIQAHVEFLDKYNLRDRPPKLETSRSKQLAEVHQRLKNLRNELKPEKPNTDVDKGRTKVSFVREITSTSDDEINYPSSVKRKRRDEHLKESIRKCLRLNKHLLFKESVSSSDSDSLNGDDEIARLRGDYKKKEGKENRSDAKKKYRRQRGLLTDNKQTNIKINSKQPPKKTKNADDKKQPDKFARKLAGIYGRSRDREPCRKRSASSSPVARRKFKSRLVLHEDDILPVMQEEFPFMYMSPRTAKLLWREQMRQVDILSKTRPYKSQRHIDEALRKQDTMSKIMKKELEHNRRLKEQKKIREEENQLRHKLREKRQTSARARRYYHEFVIRNKARMLKQKTREEKLFKEVFRDGLEIQKQRIREMREYAKEKKETNAQNQQNEIDSLENYYRDQFNMLAESVSQERYELEVRQKAQTEVMRKMRLEMRRRMESDIRNLQTQLVDDDDSLAYRNLDADRLRREFKLASYKVGAKK